MTKYVYFCAECDRQLETSGWGLRAECPFCERIVTIKKVLVTALEEVSKCR
jgi:DNA-directed RNA polymerase subunit RPC12/RpoP